MEEYTATVFDAPVTFTTSSSTKMTKKRLRMTPNDNSNMNDDTYGANSGTSTKQKTTSSSTSFDHPFSSKEFPILDDENLLQIILSFVDKHQYRFVGSVNRIFQKVYVSLYPNKTTRLNATTMGLAKLCLEDIAATRPNDSHYINYYITWKVLPLLLKSAVQSGNKDIIRYVLDFPTEMLDLDDWRYELCSLAAEFDQMELLQWANDTNLYVNKKDVHICRSAVGSGHQHIFDWAVQNGFNGNISETHNHRGAAEMAARKGLLEVLQCLYRKGCDGDCFTICNSSIVCKHAAEGGHLEVLQWLRSVGCNWDESVFFYAIKSKNVEVVQYMMDNGFDNVHGAARVAARYGCMDVLNFLHTSNYELAHDVINYAAAGGNIDIIIWALDNVYTLTTRTSFYAASNDQLMTLKWLFTRGCPWDETTTKGASNEKIYSFAKSNGCPIAEGNPRHKGCLLDESFWMYFR